MSHTLTVQISETTFEQLERAAALAKKSVNVIVESSLTHILAPLVQDIPVEYQPDVYPLLEMNESDLRREVFQRFSEEQSNEYEQLLEEKRERALTQSEQTRFDELKRQANVIMLRKGYAAVLLKQRGYVVPSLQEPSTAL